MGDDNSDCASQDVLYLFFQFGNLPVSCPLIFQSRANAVVENAAEEQNEQTLQAVGDGENVGEHVRRHVHEESRQPRNAQQTA